MLKEPVRVEAELRLYLLQGLYFQIEGLDLVPAQVELDTRALNRKRPLDIFHQVYFRG